MARELKEYQLIERSIIKKYRKNIWNPFIEAVKKYNLIEQGDSILVAVDNTAKSMLLAKLMQQLQRVSDVEFELGFSIDSSALQNASRLNISQKSVSYNKLTCTICFDDVIEYLLNSMMNESAVKSLMPSFKKNGVSIIAPLFCIKQEYITAFVRYNNLCLDTEDATGSINELIKELEKNDKDITQSIFKSIHSVCLDTMLGYEENGDMHSFLEKY